MKKDKSPSPEGLNLGFYHQFWDICWAEVFRARCSWLENGVFPPSFNMTNISIIPKGGGQTSMKY